MSVSAKVRIAMNETHAFGRIDAELAESDAMDIAVSGESGEVSA